MFNVFIAQTSMSERTSGCIALCPTGNKNGPVKFLHLKSGKVIIGDNWKELPIPDNIIEYMNNQAKKESRTCNRDTTFIWRNQS